MPNDFSKTYVARKNNILRMIRFLTTGGVVPNTDLKLFIY